MEKRDFGQELRNLVRGLKERFAKINSRSFGFDTIFIALGRLKKGFAESADVDAEFDVKVAKHVVATLDLFADRCQAASYSDEGVNFEIAGWARRLCVRCKRPGAKPEPGSNGESKRCFELTLKDPATGRATRMEITILCDKNGCWWLNISANPTSLVLGYNARAVRLSGQLRSDERRKLMRLPFRVLQAVLQTVDPTFAWGAATELRIKKLAVRLKSSQVFMYVPLPKGLSRAEFLGFFRLMYALPSAKKNRDFGQIGDALRLKISDRGEIDDVQTLLIQRMAGFSNAGLSRQIASVGFYDKGLKADVDSQIGGCPLVSPEDEEFFKTHVRLDITLHDGALTKLWSAAGLGQAEQTLSNYCFAISRLDAGEGKSKSTFAQWLFDFVFVECLALQRLLRFEPARLAHAMDAAVNAHPSAAGRLNQWLEEGFEGTKGDSGNRQAFIPYMTQQGPNGGNSPQAVTDVIARSLQSILEAKGIDPNLPLRACRSFYAATYYFAMTPEQQARYTEALESGAQKMIVALQASSRAEALKLVRSLSRALPRMRKLANSPTVTVATKLRRRRISTVPLYKSVPSDGKHERDG